MSRQHAQYSASGAERYLNCNASIKHCENIPPPPQSAAAEEGDRAHHCLEQFLTVFGFGGVRERLREEGFPKDMIEFAYDAYNEILDLKKPHHELLVEEKVDASFFTKPGQYGYLDVALVEEFGRLTVIDFKYGKGHMVEPEENPQLIYYALAVAKRYDFNFSEVELMVIQPRAFHESGKTTRSWVTSIEHLDTWAAKFKMGVKKCESPNPQFKSGSWCHFCVGKVTCPELSKKAFEEAGLDFKNIPAKVDKKSLQKKNIGFLLDAAEKIEMWISGVRLEAWNTLNKGGVVKGWKLVPKKGKRAWLKPETAQHKAHKYLGVEVYHQDLKSPAQIEKLIKQKISKDRQKGMFEWLNKNTAKVSKGLTMVREKDPRPATSSVIEDFSGITIGDDDE